MEGMGLLLYSIIYLVYAGFKRKTVRIMHYFDANKFIQQIHCRD